jgi:hypothetical protein
MALSTNLRYKGSRSLCDERGVKQGLPGCLNEEVKVNDVLLEADGIQVTGKTLEAVSKILQGPPGTLVPLTWRREADGSTFKITALRNFGASADSPQSMSFRSPTRPASLAGSFINSPPGSAMTAGSFGAAGSGSASVGLSIRQTHPYIIKGILKIFDPDGVAQGMPGYANPPVAVGDQIIEVEGTPTSGMDGAQIRDALRGVEGCGPPRPPRSLHCVTLARAAQIGGRYAVFVVPSKGDGTRI